MFWKKPSRPDPDLQKLSDAELRKMPLGRLQRLRNKRWANQKHELVERAEAEIARRDPRPNWQCLRCGNRHFHEKQIRVQGTLASALMSVSTEKFHFLVCDYCGKSELFGIMMEGNEKILDFLSG